MPAQSPAKTSTIDDGVTAPVVRVTSSPSRRYTSVGVDEGAWAVVVDRNDAASARDVTNVILNDRLNYCTFPN